MTQWQATVFLRAAVFFTFWSSIDLLLKSKSLNLYIIEVYNDIFDLCFLKQNEIYIL